MATNLRLSWAYTLKQEELAMYLNEFSLDERGKVDELRKRFAEFLKCPHEPEQLKRLLEIQQKHDTTDTLNIPSPRPGAQTPSISWQTPTGTKTNVGRSPVKIEQSGNSRKEDDSNLAAPITPMAEIMDVVRRWGVKFDGNGDPLEFCERIEELSVMYNIPLNQVPHAMPELFKGKTLIWFRNNNKRWKSWEEFKRDFAKFFLPPRYFEKLDDEIRKRTQRGKEPFKEYVLALQNLMRHTELTESQKLERIFRNAHPDYMWYIRRRDFSCLDELISMAEDLECIPGAANQQRGGDRHGDQRIGGARRDQCYVSSSSNQDLETTRRRQNMELRTSLQWQESKITARILLEGKLVTATIDTGASKSFIKKSYLRSLKKNIKYHNDPLEVILADSSIVKTTKATNLDISFGNISASCTLWVMEEFNEDILLGLDFLQVFNTTISCAGLSVQCGADVSEAVNCGMITHTTPEDTQP